MLMHGLTFIRVSERRLIEGGFEKRVRKSFSSSKWACKELILR